MCVLAILKPERNLAPYRDCDDTAHVNDMKPATSSTRTLETSIRCQAASYSPAVLLPEATNAITQINSPEAGVTVCDQARIG